MKPSNIAGAALVKVVGIGVDGKGPWKGSVEVAEECLTASRGDVEDAVRRCIRLHVRYAGTSGGVSGAPGLLLLPVTLPGGIAALYVTAARMTGCVAYLRGYDIQSEEVRTVVLVTLLGSSGAQALKGVGIEIGQKAALAQLKKLPGTVLTRINQRAGWRLVTKFGEKGTVNLHRFIPLVGVPIGVTVDALACRSIGKYAVRHFPPLESVAGSTAADPRTYNLSGDGRRRHLSVVVDGQQVARASFDVDEDSGRLELTQVDTDESRRREGHATHALRYLFAAFPHLHVIASPSDQNTNEGEALIQALRDEGLDLHHFGCYRSGERCTCGLEAA